LRPIRNQKARAAADENAKRWARLLAARGLQDVWCASQQRCWRRVRPQPRDIELVSLGDHALLTSASTLRPAAHCARGLSLDLASESVAGEYPLWGGSPTHGRQPRSLCPRASYTLACVCGPQKRYSSAHWPSNHVAEHPVGFDIALRSSSNPSAKFLTHTQAVSARNQCHGTFKQGWRRVAITNGDVPRD